MGPFAKDDPVAKGPVTRCLDELSTRPDGRERLTVLRQAIRDIGGQEFHGLEEVFARYLFPDFYDRDQIRRITEYLRTYWFSQATGWWPAFQPIAPIYGLGLLQSLASSLAALGKAPLPIDSYWIVGHGQVELVNLVSPRQVTLLIATPAPPEMAPAGVLGESSEVWVTARRAGHTDDEINPTTGQPVQGTSDLRVRTFKIRTRPAPRP
jgi:hypothetical protein